MKTIKIEVKSCEECLNYNKNDEYSIENVDYCMAAKDGKFIRPREIPDITTIPDWCELEDAPINADENCYYQGGHGCGNIRMDVPWKEMVIGIKDKS